MERRREEVLAEVKHKKDEKKKVLEEQLKLINTEKSQVDKDVQVIIFGTLPYTALGAQITPTPIFLILAPAGP